MNGNLPNILSEDSQVAVPIRCTFNDLNAVFDGLSDEEDLKKGNEVCQQDVLSENSAIQTTIRNDEAKKSVTESTSTLIKLIDSLLQKLSSSFNLELFKDLPSSLKKLLCSDAEITVNGHEVEGIVRILENLSNNAFAGIPEGSTKSKEEHTSASGSELSNGHTDFVNKSEAHGTVGNDLERKTIITKRKKDEKSISQQEEVPRTKSLRLEAELAQFEEPPKAISEILPVDFVMRECGCLNARDGDTFDAVQNNSPKREKTSVIKRKPKKECIAKHLGNHHSTSVASENKNPTIFTSEEPDSSCPKSSVQLSSVHISVDDQKTATNKKRIAFKSMSENSFVVFYEGTEWDECMYCPVSYSTYRLHFKSSRSVGEVGYRDAVLYLKSAVEPVCPAAYRTALQRDLFSSSDEGYRRNWIFVDSYYDLINEKALVRPSPKEHELLKPGSILSRISCSDFDLRYFCNSIDMIDVPTFGLNVFVALGRDWLIRSKSTIDEFCRDFEAMIANFTSKLYKLYGRQYAAQQSKVDGFILSEGFDDIMASGKIQSAFKYAQMPKIVLCSIPKTSSPIDYKFDRLNKTMCDLVARHQTDLNLRKSLTHGRTKQTLELEFIDLRSLCERQNSVKPREIVETFMKYLRFDRGVIMS